MTRSFLVIRADATPLIGTGHIMRCLALAQAAQDVGMDVCMVGRIGVPWVLERLSRESIPFVAIDDTLQETEDPAKLLQQLCLAGLADYNCAPNPAWVVLDGYHFGPDCHKAVRAAGYKLLVIDDYNHLPEYYCDILLNQNIGAEHFKYHGNITTRCLGLEYVLLREEFAKARPQTMKRLHSDTPQHVLLTLGGGNFFEHLYRIAPCFTTGSMQGRTLSIIAGAMPPHDIQHAFANCPAPIKILQRVEDMPALLLETDICITAGGSTCWELACLGVPFLVIETASNQSSIVKNLCSRGISALFTPSSFEDFLAGNYAKTSADLMNFIHGSGASTLLTQLEE